MALRALLSPRVSRYACRMSFDVYAGPLCCYYARAARSPTDPEQEAARDLLPSIRGWQRIIAPALRSAGVGHPEWDERIDAPTFTQDLTHEGYWAVRLVAAYAQFDDLAEPPNPPTIDSLAGDPALARLRSHESRSRFAHVHACEAWLPLRIAEPISLEMPSGRTHPVGGVEMLKAELAALQRVLIEGTSANASPSRTIARGALDTWHALAETALRSRVPVMLDY